MFVDRKHFSIIFILPNQGDNHFYHMLPSFGLWRKKYWGPRCCLQVNLKLWCKHYFVFHTHCPTIHDFLPQSTFKPIYVQDFTCHLSFKVSTFSELFIYLMREVRNVTHFCKISKQQKYRTIQGQTNCC